MIIEQLKMNNRTIRIFFLTGMLACFFIFLADAQPGLKSSVDRNEILIGEQFKLKIEVNFIADTYRLPFIKVPDSLQHFEVIDRSKIDSVYTNNQLSGITQTFTFTSFDSGKWVLPSFLVGLAPLKDDTTYNYFTDSVPITVAFSTSDTTNQLKDIKPIRQVEVRSAVWYWIGGGVLLIALIVLLIWWLRRRRKKPYVSTFGPPSNVSAYDEAMSALNALQAYNFFDPVDIKIVHTQMGEILRRYFSRRENDNYLTKTTGDILILLKHFGVDTELLSKVAATTRTGDAVKFAKYLPEPVETNNCIASLKELIESFKQKNAPKPLP
ncbi:hypothetical protein BH11BAC3_BH11BAC3_12400 [soil metagenome]